MFDCNCLVLKQSISEVCQIHHRRCGEKDVAHFGWGDYAKVRLYKVRFWDQKHEMVQKKVKISTYKIVQRSKGKLPPQAQLQNVTDMADISV